MNHDEKKLVRIAQKHGARVVAGGKHLNIFVGDELIFSLSKGSAKNGDTKAMLTVWRRRGWL